VFINPGRGTIVDEAALAAALDAGRLAGAVLDVFEQEPLPPDHVFWRTPNVIITGHTAALSMPADVAPVFIDNYRRLLNGEPLRHRVDFDLGY
jgi:glyoxylate/hydroxypyruvate reductase A